MRGPARSRLLLSRAGHGEASLDEREPHNDYGRVVVGHSPRPGSHLVLPGGRSATGRQVGAPPDQRPLILEEAGAVGAQVLRDKLARKLGLTRKRPFGLLPGPGITPHYAVETVHKFVYEPQARSAWWLSSGDLARLYGGHAACAEGCQRITRKERELLETSALLHREGLAEKSCGFPDRRYTQTD